MCFFVSKLGLQVFSSDFMMPVVLAARVRQLRFGPVIRILNSVTNQTVSCALPIVHVYGVLIGACDPMAQNNKYIFFRARSTSSGLHVRTVERHHAVRIPLQPHFHLNTYAYLRAPPPAPSPTIVRTSPGEKSPITQTPNSIPLPLPLPPTPPPTHLHPHPPRRTCGRILFGGLVVGLLLRFDLRGDPNKKFLYDRNFDFHALGGGAFRRISQQYATPHAPCDKSTSSPCISNGWCLQSGGPDWCLQSDGVSNSRGGAIPARSGPTNRGSAVASYP